MKKFLSLFAAILFAGSMMAANYVKTAYADIQTDDVVIITMQNANGVYAASNDQGSSKAPVATEVTVADDAITTDATNILWTVVKDGDNITFKVGDDALYCTSTNNGMRVGSNSNNVFSINAESGYLFNNATNRYIGVYNSQDFRCYTSVNSNIKDQTLAFFVLDEGGDPTPTLENGFYLVGTMNEWTPAAEYHFTGNPENPAEFMLATTLAEGQELKVGNVVNNEITAWYPGGDNYVVDAAHAGEKTIYFQPDYKADWSAFGGYFYIAANEEPVVENPDFYIAGTMTSWADEKIAVTGTSYKLNLEAGDYQLKVIVGEGEAAQWKGYDALTTVANGLTRGEGENNDNICFTLTEAGEVNVHYDGEFFFLNGDFYVAPVVVHYYFKNNWGGEEWTWKEITNEEGYYMLGPVAVGGEGVNFHTAMVDEGAPYITWAEIDAFDASFEPAVIGAGDSVVFFFDPEQVNTYTGANGLSAQITYKYVAPVEPEDKLPVVAIAGTMNEWSAEANIMANATDSLSASVTIALEAQKYEFKVVSDGKWLSLNGEGETLYGIHREWNEVAHINGVDIRNFELTADVAGEYTFTWTYADSTLVVTFPEKPAELQAVSEATAWDFSKITANTENALYSNNGIKLTDSSTPTKNEEVVYANYSADFMTFAEGFDATTMAFQGEYPIRKNKYCQAGTLHFKTTVAGTITVKFSDTGSNASATAVKRYLVVNGEQTEYWTSRQNNGEEPYEAQLDVTSGEIEVPAGDVTITGSSAIVVYNVTFAPKVEEPAKFYITGDAALVGEELAWNPAAIKSTETSYKLNLAAGDYKLKVVVGEGEAAQWKGFDALTTTADGLTADEDGNICFTLAEAGEVNVHYDGEFFYLNGDFYVAPVVVKYYLKNNWGSEAWSWKEMTDLGDGTYMLYNVVVGGEGVNRNTAESDEGASWFTWTEIETFDASYEPATIGALDTVVIYFDPEAVNGFTGANGMSAQILGKYVAPVEEGCDWENIAFLGDGSPEQTFGNQFKVCKEGDVPGVVNIQKPGFAAETGIYVTFPSAAFGEISLAEGQYVINGAGMVLYLSAFTAQETEVSVVCEGNTYVFTVYNALGGAPELNYYMKNNWDAVSDWTWKAMTKDGETYKLENVVFGGTGVNYNTADSDEGSSWVPVANIAGDAISAKDTVTLVLDPAAGTVTATLIGKYNDPNPGEHTYTVAGNLTAAFGTAWNPADAHNDMVLNGVGIYLWEKTELTLPKGTIMFKVCEDHAWDVAYPAQDYELAIPETGVYTIYIAFNPDTKEVTANATKTGDATVTVDYYLVGSAKGWEAKAENIFTLNAEAGEGIEEYVIETTLEVGEGLKVVSSTGTWYPEGMGNEYVVDQNHAGATTIYFRPAGNAEWEAFGGYMYVVPTGTVDIDAVDANAPAVKVLRNGQIFIIKGDKTYNVMGALVR